MKKPIESIFLLFTLTVLLISGCVPASTPEPTPKSVPPTIALTSTVTATLTPPPTATLSPEQQLTSMVNESKITNKFPSGLTTEQKIAFIDELNNQAGENLGQKYWVNVEINPDTNQLSVLLNGEWLTIAGSENISIEQWQTPITKDNLDEKIASGEFSSPKGREFLGLKDLNGFLKDFPFDNALIPVVLLPIPESGIFGFDEKLENSELLRVILLPLLQVVFIPDENGIQIPIGRVLYLAKTSMNSLIFLKEGSNRATTNVVTYPGETSFNDRGNIQVLSPYYVVISEGAFEGYNLFDLVIKNHSFIISPKESYDLLTNPKSDLLSQQGILTVNVQAGGSVLIKVDN